MEEKENNKKCSETITKIKEKLKSPKKVTSLELEEILKKDNTLKE